MRLTDTPPAYCSGCFLSKPDQRHVDLEVSWDGPVITDGIKDEDGQTVHTIPTSIDDLVLCEDCLTAAAGLMGLVDPGDTAVELGQLRAANERLAEEKRGLEEYASRMEAAVSAKPEPARTRKATVKA